MRTLILCLAVVGIAGLMTGCNSCNTGCDPAPACCEDVYKSPCCPAPDQGVGYDAGSGGGGGGGASCGSSCGGGGGSCS